MSTPLGSDNGPHCGGCRAANPGGTSTCTRCQTPLTPQPAQDPATADATAKPTEPASAAPPATRRWRARRQVVVAANAAVAAALVTGGAVLWLTRPHLLDTDQVAQTIGQRISQQIGQPVTVHCPGTARREQGETFQCSVTAANGLHHIVVVTVADDHGHVTWHTRT